MSRPTRVIVAGVLAIVVVVGIVAVLLTARTPTTASSSTTGPGSDAPTTVPDSDRLLVARAHCAQDLNAGEDFLNEGGSGEALMREYGANSPVYKAITQLRGERTRQEMKLGREKAAPIVGDWIRDKCLQIVATDDRYGAVGLTPPTTAASSSTMRPTTSSPSTTAAPPAAQPSAFALSPGGLGSLSFGTSMDQVRSALVAQFGAPTRSSDEQCLQLPGRSLTVISWGGLEVDGLDGKFVGWSLDNAVGASTPNLKAANGISIGSTVGDLQAAYPSKVTFTNRFGNPNDAIFVVAGAPDQSMTGSVSSTAPNGQINTMSAAGGTEGVGACRGTDG